ncbi:MAG TPA: Asp-tRNA(Asn)/Glu-tRNA(Gln) amidotransferase subunit GatC [Candidatus Dormibacteraeota bacterium]|nr:Asp-tRNA(Asn)/Glu-tRNA(Gln) amidotransferase subunit GatC [Candidatus Dormibacteraeota bacterium]
MAEERASAPQAGSIAPSEVAHVSRLARLGLTPSELEKLAAQLEVIVAAVGKLALADTSSVEATAQVGSLRNVTRADEVAPGLSADEALANASVQVAGFLRVPAIQ